VLSVIDVTRECLALEVDTSFASRRVTRELDRIVAERGVRKRFAATTVRNLHRGIFWRGDGTEDRTGTH